MNDRCRDGNECFETLVSFAWTHCYASVFLEFAETVFDQMSLFVGLLVEFGWELPVGFGCDDRG